MSYTALARKWRPKTFAEMSGQEHVLKALANALDSGRVHHAFLFTGTRGVGKTTVARIFAKCLNCERGVSAQPCGECSACRDIDAGRFIDLIEVDAASRTKVDDTRELLENVQYMPSRGRYKVYLIDEVHMLTTHSFNALLKTLEEPPPHVKFLLATTDPQKLLATVLSRCLQFNLKRLSVGLIIARLTQILAAEGIETEPAALRLLAVAADGSLRDALSLLDQLLAYGNGRVRDEDARAMLGAVDRHHVVRVAELLADQDAAGLITYAQSLEQWAPDYAQLLEELNGLLVQVALQQVVPDGGRDQETYAPELIAALAARLAPEDVQLYYQIGLHGRRDLPLSADPRAGFAMTLVRMLAFRPGAAATPPGGGTPEATTRQRSVATPAPPTPVPGRSPAAASAPATPPPAGTLTVDNWSSVVASLDLGGLARQLATHSVFTGRNGTTLRFVLEARNVATKNRASEERLAAALSRFLGETVRVEMEVATAAVATPAREQARRSDEQLDAARQALETDPSVLALKERFGASLHPDSVRLSRPAAAIKPEEN